MWSWCTDLRCIPMCRFCGTQHWFPVVCLSWTGDRKLLAIGFVCIHGIIELGRVREWLVASTCSISANRPPIEHKHVYSSWRCIKCCTPESVSLVCPCINSVNNLAMNTDMSCRNLLEFWKLCASDLQLIQVALQYHKTTTSCCGNICNLQYA